jgi:UDP-glucose 4-epimerase
MSGPVSGPVNGLDGHRVLVTGGAGFIGSHLVDAVLADGAAEVVVVDDLTNGRRSNLDEATATGRVDLRVADIRDAAAVTDAVRGIDVAYNLACLGVRHSLREPFVNHDVNATGTLVVLEAARASCT